jgi:hypothetical protein
MGSLARTPINPVAARKTNNTALVSVKRTMLAETGFVSDKAFL